MTGVHLLLNRPRPATLYANYRIVEAVKEPAPSVIPIVDGVLTTGAHFKAVQRILSEIYPRVKPYGVFLVLRA